MKNNIDLIMLGDSLTAVGEWSELLKPYHIINMGRAGDKTNDILQRLDEVISLNPKYCFLLLGINDISSSYAISKIFSKYKIIINSLNEKKIKVVVQSTISTTMPILNIKVKSLNELLELYCLEKGIDFIDINTHFIDEEGLLKNTLTTDGLHLSLKAYKVWAYMLFKYLNSK